MILRKMVYKYEKDIAILSTLSHCCIYLSYFPITITTKLDPLSQSIKCFNQNVNAGSRFSSSKIPRK